MKSTKDQGRVNRYRSEMPQNTESKSADNAASEGWKSSPKSEKEISHFHAESEKNISKLFPDKGNDQKQNDMSLQAKQQVIQWKKDRKDDGTPITFTTEDKARERQSELEKKGRWANYHINSSSDKKSWWVEVAEPQRIFRVAWTIDDGPQGVNTESMKTEGLGGLKTVTWYIQRNKINGKDAEYKKLKSLQDNGGEIAIHSFHVSGEHAFWFPVAAKDNPGPYSTPYEGKTEADAMNDLKSFYDDLKKHEINVKFVRLPGGLYSELYAYAKTKGFTDDKIRDQLARDIIAKKDITHYGPKAVEMQSDFNTMKAKLSELELMEWQGTVDPLTIATMSWQAETSGVLGRKDSTTKLISPGAKYNATIGKGTLPEQAGKFEQKLDQMEATNQNSGSLVILTHDSSIPDAKAVNEDKTEMERLAEIRGVKIEYHTMSSLFNIVTGKDAKTYDVKY